MISEKIREKSENYFSEACILNDLHCSSMSKDHTGKDFIVEWPDDETYSNVSSDMRPTRRRCEVQVKGTQGSLSRIQLKLSAADWLVKSDLPTFIVGIALNSSLEVTKCVIFHVWGQTLERILKGLREASLKGKKLTSAKISFDLKSGQVVAKSEIRRHLEQLIGNDMRQYASEKQAQRENLGFDDDYRTRITFSANFRSTDEILNAFLGQSKLPVENIEVFEKRFGIEIPNRTITTETGRRTLRQSGFIEISPRALDCKFRVVSPTGMSAEIAGKAILSDVPNLPANTQRMIFRTQEITLTINLGKKLLLVSNMTFLKL